MHRARVVGEQDAAEFQQSTEFAQRRPAREAQRRRGRKSPVERVQYVRRQRNVRRPAENQPATMEPALSFERDGDKPFVWPAFGRTIFSARIQAEPERIAGQREFLLYGGHFPVGHREEWRQWFRVCPERADEAQIPMEMMRGGRRSVWPVACCVGRRGGGAASDFTDGTFAHPHKTGVRLDRLSQ